MDVANGFRMLIGQRLAPIVAGANAVKSRLERDEMAIPGFLHLALKSIESEAAKGEANNSQPKAKR